MKNKRILVKGFSVFVVCCFLSSVHISQVCALGQQEKLFREVPHGPTFEKLFEQLDSPEFCAAEAGIDESVLENIRTAATDLPGLIVIYNIFMFIYYGRLCLETLDPAPCSAMVNHLVIALFLGILLEGI